MSETSIHHSDKYKITNITIDMKKRFPLKGFALRSTKVCCWLKSYSFMGSNDNTNWNLIRYNSNEDLKNNIYWHAYSVNNSIYRYYGIFQDPDSSKAGCGSEYYFALSGLDFIKINNDEREKGMCNHATIFKTHIFVYIFIAR